MHKGKSVIQSQWLISAREDLRIYLTVTPAGHWQLLPVQASLFLNLHQLKKKKGPNNFLLGQVVFY